MRWSERRGPGRRTARLVDLLARWPNRLGCFRNHRLRNRLGRLLDGGGFTVVEAMVGSLILAVALAGLFILQSALSDLDQRRRRDAEIGVQLVRVAELSRAMGYAWWSQQVDEAPGQSFADTPYEGSGFSVQRSAVRVLDAGMPSGLIRVTLQAITAAGAAHGRITFLLAENGL